MNILKKFLNEISVNDKKIIYLIYFLPISILAGSLIINLTILILIFLFLYEIVKKKKINIFYNFYILLLFIIFIYLLYNSVFVAKDSDSIIRACGFLRYIILALAIAYYLNIENKKYEKKILLFWTVIFSIVTLDLIFEFIFGFNTLNFRSDYEGRLASFTGDELKIGGYYFGFYLLSLVLFIQNKKTFNILMIVFLISAYLIGERSNFIKIIFMTTLFYFFCYKLNFFKKLLIFTVPVFLIFLITLFNFNFKERFYNLLINPIINNNLEKTLSENRHLAHYRSAIEIFKDNKILGIGIKKFRYESYRRQVELNQYQGSTHPHQIHLEFLSELGFVGYTLIMTFLIYSIINGYKVFKLKNDLYSAAASLFIFATIIPILPSGSFFTTYGATIFWINFSFILRNKIKINDSV